MLSANDTVVLIIDVQEKLVRAMSAPEELIGNCRKLIRGARALDVPVLATEQNPKGLGPTVPELAGLLPGPAPAVKFSFSCGGCEEFMGQLRREARRNVLIAGIEAHVCVYQTAVDLEHQGFRVEVAADACDSRRPADKRIGLEKCRDAGVGITCVETALFELLKAAEGPAFKEIMQIVK
jgi:nicotinamidase-related amidase